MRISFKPRSNRPRKSTWFAWHPVKTECGTWVWLEKVRFRQDNDWGGPYYMFYLMDGSS